MANSTSSILGALRLDVPAEVDRICTEIRLTVLQEYKKRGIVVGVSGGVDSAVVAFLCALAVGSDHLIALSMPDAESSTESVTLAKMIAHELKVPLVIEDISPALKALGCYERRDSIIRTIVPEYGDGYKMKLTVPAASEEKAFSLSSLVVRSPAGTTTNYHLPLAAYLGIVASMNLKQRTRMMMEYFHAEKSNYAVAGTPNRLEYDQGFFVKYGDGAADFKPIAHLYKSQVYQLAGYLGVPPEIRERVPTTDTYSLEQTQEEFYFSVPLVTMDICIYAHDHNISVAEVASTVGLSTSAIERLFEAIDRRRRISKYLHATTGIAGSDAPHVPRREAV